MKIHIVLLGLICAVCGDIQAQNYAQYVRPLIGTDIRIVQGKTKGSTEERGQIIPATGVPHSMTNWVAQTEPTEQKCHPPYYYFHGASRDSFNVLIFTVLILVLIMIWKSIGWNVAVIQRILPCVWGLVR